MKVMTVHCGKVRKYQKKEKQEEENIYDSQFCHPDTIIVNIGIFFRFFSL